MGNRNAIDGKLWGCFLAGLMLLFTCGLQGCKNSQSESPSRASRVVSPSGEEGAAEPLPASPTGSEPFPVNPPSMLPPHNAWGGSTTGLDMEVFGPGGTVVFRSHAYPFGERMERKNQKPSMTGTSDSQVQD